jgi:hypothetical protein
MFAQLQAKIVDALHCELPCFQALYYRLPPAAAPASGKAFFLRGSSH